MSDWAHATWRKRITFIMDGERRELLHVSAEGDKEQAVDATIGDVWAAVQHDDELRKALAPIFLPNPPKSDACGSCFFWRSAGITSHGSATGHCRRRPPSIIASLTANGDWPSTYATDWCGEYRMKQDSTQSLPEEG